MSTVICPNCRRSVSITEDGKCPVCQVPFGNRPKDRAMLVDSVFKDEDSASDFSSLIHAEPGIEPALPRSTGVSNGWGRRTSVALPAPRSDRSHATSPMPERRSVVLEHGLLWILFAFRGRIPRRVFWCTEALRCLAIQPFAVSIAYLSGRSTPTSQMGLTALFALSLWIVLAVHVKRWHDRGKTAWWEFMILIPLIGPIWLLVELGCLRGTVGWNDYGPDPT